MFQLHPFQAEALSLLEKPGHLLCLAPTGSGKSLIYEKLAETRRFRILLFSPLVALARQQFSRLKTLEVPVSLGSGTDSRGPPKSGTGAWIVSPEILFNPRRKEELSLWKPDLLVVDECHCLWEWGDGFRPAFQLIPRLIDEHSIKRSLWLTATLASAEQRELESYLPEPFRKIGRFELPPLLHFEAIRAPWIERTHLLCEKLQTQTGSGILFAPTRDSTERLARLVAGMGKRVAIYHAGLSDEERRNAEKAIAENKADVIVATSAFGMGMHHPQLRWAISWQAPPSLLSLTQAAGRVGRSPTHRSDAFVFWDFEDFKLWEWAVRGSLRRRKALWDTFQFLRSERCRQDQLEHYFNGSSSQSWCGRCDFCKNFRAGTAVIM